jgi:hypothetical protein
MPKFRERLRLDKLSSAASTAIDVVVDGDSDARLHIEAGGKIVWGGGGAPGDVNLFRDSSGVLRTDGTLKSSILIVDDIEIDTTGATGPQALVFNGTKFVPTTITIEPGATVSVSDTAPSTPSVGDLWFESDTGKTFVYYDYSWVEIGAQPLGQTGPTGPSGPSGPLGPTGSTGPTGPTGFSVANIDGGFPSTNYGGITSLDSGGV